jgi:hypothetical protein
MSLTNLKWLPVLSNSSFRTKARFYFDYVISFRTFFHELSHAFQVEIKSILSFKAGRRFGDTRVFTSNNLDEYVKKLRSERFFKFKERFLNSQEIDKLQFELGDPANVRSIVFHPSTKEQEVKLGIDNNADVLQVRMSHRQIDLLQNLSTHIIGVLESAYAMNFQLAFVNAYRTYPLRSEPYMSSLWHYDHVTRCQTPHEYKAMIFLRDVTSMNGPLTVTNYRINRRWKLRLKGKSYGNRVSQQFLDRHNVKQTECIGQAGDVYLFATDIVHKAGTVLEGFRDVVVLGFYPMSALPKLEQSLSEPKKFKTLIDTDIRFR